VDRHADADANLKFQLCDRNKSPTQKLFYENFVKKCTCILWTWEVI